MELSFKNHMIRDIRRISEGNQNMYWKLYRLSDTKLLKLYKLLVPYEERSVSLKNLPFN